MIPTAFEDLLFKKIKCTLIIGQKKKKEQRTTSK